MSAVEFRQPAAGAAPAPGRRLAEARAAQSLTQSDVARQLKLSVWQVEALESGRYQQLPGAIFVRGFIRNYARLVKLDPDALVQSLGDSVPAPSPRPEPSPSRDIPFPATGGRRWVAWGAAAAVLLGLLALYEFFLNESAEPGAAPAPASTEPRSRPASAKPAATVAAAEPASPATPAPADGRGEAVQAAAVPASDPPAKRGERQVKLAFDQECWVEIRDRNERVIFSQLNRPGTEQSVTGLPPFSVVVGNAHGVRLTYDDKPIDLAPHTKVDVARLILP